MLEGAMLEHDLAVHAMKHRSAEMVRPRYDYCPYPKHTNTYLKTCRICARERLLQRKRKTQVLHRYCSFLLHDPILTRSAIPARRITHTPSLFLLACRLSRSAFLHSALFPHRPNPAVTIVSGHDFRTSQCRRHFELDITVLEILDPTQIEFACSGDPECKFKGNRLVKMNISVRHGFTE
jgi:hypothetical protein